MTPQRQHAMPTYTARLRRAFRGGDERQRPGWWIGFTGDAKLWWVSDEYEAEIVRLFPEFDAYRSQGQLL